MRTSSISLVLLVAFVLVLASVQANAKRLTWEEKQKLKANRDRKLISSAQQKSGASAVPTAVTGAKDSNNKDVVTDQNKGGKSGATEKNEGGNNNEESDANPTLGRYGAGSNSDSSPDTHHNCYYLDDGRPRRQDLGDRKPKH